MARIQQGRQDLNLQPAVLETAALPVELRPFAGWQANLLVLGLHLTPLLRIASLCIVVDAHNARAIRGFNSDSALVMGKPRGPSVHRGRSQRRITPS
jgi:hypothetical protein